MQLVITETDVKASRSISKRCHLQIVMFICVREGFVLWNCQRLKVFLKKPCGLSCIRESAVNIVRSGSYTRQPWRDESKGNEAPHSGAPTTYVSTYLKRYAQFFYLGSQQSYLLLTRLPNFNSLPSARCMSVIGLETFFFWKQEMKIKICQHSSC